MGGPGESHQVDDEQEVVEGPTLEQDVHEALQIYRRGQQGESGDRDDSSSLEQDGRLSGGGKDHQRYVLLHYQRIPVQPTRTRGPRGEDCEEQGEDRLREAVRRLRHAGLRLDEGGRQVPGRVVREKQRGGPELLLDCRLRQSHEILEQKERGRL